MQLAFLHGDPVVAFDMTQDQFDALKRTVRDDPECLRFADRLRAIPRGGEHRIRHFSHRPGEGGHNAHETIHHVRAKKAIRDVATRRGWNAALEVTGPDRSWRADVLLTRDELRVAFEVQWSHQSEQEYQARTARYRADGIQTVWLTKYTPHTWPLLHRTVDALPYQAAGCVGTRAPSYQLEAAIDACLEYLESRPLPIPDDAPQHFATTCYRCHRRFAYKASTELWGAKEPFTSDEIAALGNFAAKLWVDHSDTIKKEYPMWHCPHCGAKQGDFYSIGRPYVLVDGKPVPDTRSTRLWDILAARLEGLHRAMAPEPVCASPASARTGVLRQARPALSTPSTDSADSAPLGPRPTPPRRAAMMLPAPAQPTWRYLGSQPERIVEARRRLHSSISPMCLECGTPLPQPGLPACDVHIGLVTGGEPRRHADAAGADALEERLTALDAGLAAGGRTLATPRDPPPCR